MTRARGKDGVSEAARMADAAAGLAGVLRLRCEGLASGLFTGPHRSARLGAGGDFESYRPAGPGEDASRVDLRVLARTGRAVVRERRAEGRVSVVLAVDPSASMRLGGERAQGGGGAPKLRMAAELAGAIAVMARRQGDVSACLNATFDQAANGRKLRTDPAGVFGALTRLGEDPAGSLAEVLERAGAGRRPVGGAGGALGGRRLAIGFGDGFEPAAGLAVAARRAAGSRGKAVLVLVRSAEEWEPTGRFLGAVRDPETGARGRVDHADYRARLSAHDAALAAALRRGGRSCVVGIDAGEEPAGALSRVVNACV